MLLTNEQYNHIMHIYSDRQLSRQRELKSRRNTLIARAPRIKEIEASIRRAAIDEVASRLYDQTDASEPGSLIDSLVSEKAALIKEAGFPPDYLEVPYVCPDCRDTGYVDGQRCHCFTQLSLELAYDSHSADLAGCSLKDFSFQYYPADYIDEETGKTSIELARMAYSSAEGFVGSFDDSFGNILITGKTGTGKTHLSRCIGGEIMSASKSVIYLTAFELFSIMKQEAFSRDNTENGDFSRMFSCDLLIIDDLGTEFPTAMTISQLFELVNQRIRTRSSTLISTNLNLSDLQRVYTERIVSRFVEYYKVLNLSGPDIRTAIRVLNTTRQRGGFYAQE